MYAILRAFLRLVASAAPSPLVILSITTRHSTLFRHFTGSMSGSGQLLSKKASVGAENRK